MLWSSIDGSDQKLKGDVGLCSLSKTHRRCVIANFHKTQLNKIPISMHINTIPWSYGELESFQNVLCTAWKWSKHEFIEGCEWWRRMWVKCKFDLTNCTLAEEYKLELTSLVRAGAVARALSWSGGHLVAQRHANTQIQSLLKITSSLVQESLHFNSNLH